MIGAMRVSSILLLWTPRVREPYFCIAWKSLCLYAQNPRRKHVFQTELTFFEFWCSQNPSQGLIFCNVNVLALRVFKNSKYALPRSTPLSFYCCQILHASAYSWMSHHIPSEKLTFRRNDIQNNTGVHTFHLRLGIGSHQCHACKYAWNI